MRTFSIAVLVLCASGPAIAGVLPPVIVVGDHHLAANTAGQTILIDVSGGQAVEGLDFNVQIGDGGPPLGGSSVGPVITKVDIITGTIFASNNTGQVDINSFPLFDASSTTTNSATVAASGLLATLTIDTTGFFGGSWPLQLGNTKNGPTDFALLSAAITDGTISIPEPTTVLLLLLGTAPLLLARSRMKVVNGRTGS